MSALGGKADAVGFVGNDTQGEWIKKTLRDEGIDSAHLGTYDRPTTLKTRYVVNGFQVLRVDREVRSDTSNAQSDTLVKEIEALVPTCDIIALADYDKGALTSYFIDAIVNAARQAGKKIMSSTQSQALHGPAGR